ncbi:hypothetical protein ES703_104463 [subsurface metagenome]
MDDFSGPQKIDHSIIQSERETPPAAVPSGKAVIVPQILFDIKGHIDLRRILRMRRDFRFFAQPHDSQLTYPEKASFEQLEIENILLTDEHFFPHDLVFDE